MMARRLINLAEVRAARARLEAILTEHPEVRERTAALFAADPTAEELETMAEESKNTNIRLPLSLIERLDCYVEHRRNHEPGLTFTRADAVRSLVHQGLDAWEQAAAPNKGKSR